MNLRFRILGFCKSVCLSNTPSGNFLQGLFLGTVGCLIDSCHSCDNCTQDLENYYPKLIQLILTYNSLFYNGSTTFGGFSDKVVVDHHYVLHFPNNLLLDAASPLLCAGITVYNPMKYFGFSEPGKHLGVVGLGGLGHMAVKFGNAFGIKVLVISTSASKQKEVLERLGADSFLVSRDPDQIQATMGTLDGILDTVLFW
ncbi:probable mannitol dehydrogenase [Macadamia integrifolia]|uniref:probable mannitol dehydrogenase n=1 Tax=Macadamia integrifolia TaxID=60698 RepID=UPI001C501A3B|nr:probable mannitol dehydrogenase [Macadamia integrifolia]